MAKVPVLCRSSFGHMEQMAKAAAEGARAGGAQATVQRVPELMPEQEARKQGMKWDQDAPWARWQELSDYDAVILGIPTRYGRRQDGRQSRRGHVLDGDAAREKDLGGALSGQARRGDRR